MTLSQDRLCEGNYKILNFIKTVEYSHIMVIGTPGAKFWYMWFLNVAMVFEFLIFIGIAFHSFAPDTETAFCPIAVLWFCLHQSRFELFSVIPCYEVKVNFFTYESADPWRFLYIRDASFSCKMLLKIIHFKSFNRGVTIVSF